MSDHVWKNALSVTGTQLLPERQMRYNKEKGNASQRSQLQPQAPTYLIIKPIRMLLLAYDKNHKCNLLKN